MSKEICISTTPHETRLAIIEDEQLTEVYYERENEYTLAGSIYKGRVTRVLPGMQSAFVDVGLERDAFLYVTDFLEEQEAPPSSSECRGMGTTRIGNNRLASNRLESPRISVPSNLQTAERVTRQLPEKSLRRGPAAGEAGEAAAVGDLAPMGHRLNSRPRFRTNPPLYWNR